MNRKQRQAVETIDGPVLVIAGPGTGKTQLIGTRVGYILKTVDIEPSNILLLTFTDAAVAEMRKRLEKLVPAQAHKVNIYTYHGFANDIIRNNLEYFEGFENEPIDELAASTIIENILERLPYNNPLKAGQYYKAQILKFISDAKKARLRPKDIEKLAKANRKFIAKMNIACRKHLDKLDRVSLKSIPIFLALAATASRQSAFIGSKLPASVRSLADYFGESLAAALEDTAVNNSTKPLTAWKNQWLAKDRDAKFIVAGLKNAERLLAASDIYQKYQQYLASSRVYDYDDMILRAIEVLETNPDFKYSLAEHYQYLMLDEFQDTNAAQLRFIELLTDAPVYEGRPNVLAVGDDDQAIYAFQGADHANMAKVAQIYRDVQVISLKQNYRSHQHLVDMAAAIAGQIETRLHHSFPGIEKTLLAAGKTAKTPPKLSAREFISDAAELTWIAKEIKVLIKSGLPENDIAVLAPQHKYLEKLLPYLARHNLAVSYEKREDVLEEPKIVMLIRIAQLVLALAEADEELADHLWPEILSYEFWRVPTETIWQIVWSSKGGPKRGQPLTALVLKHPRTKSVARFILELKDCSRIASLEEMLDAIIGIGDMHRTLGLSLKSPFFEHYFGDRAGANNPDSFTRLVSNLNLLRTRLRNRQRRERTTTHLADFVEFVDDNQTANLKILDTSPYHQSPEAVNLITAYGAKGREFGAVFVMSVQSEVWGRASRTRNQAVKLPANLEYISYSGMSDDERLRLFYVAVTRAKTRLYLSSHQQTLDGQRRNHLEFLGISRSEDESLSSAILPAKYSRIQIDESGHIDSQTAADYWAGRHLPKFKPRLNQLLAEPLGLHKLSATGLNQFIDLENYGPQYFFLYNFMGFAQAPTATSAFGSAIHDTCAWVGNYVSRHGKLPTKTSMLSHFHDKMAGGWLRQDEHTNLLSRGEKALPVWLAKIGPSLTEAEKYEKNFYTEGVQIDNVRLTGKIDRLAIDSKSRQIAVTDIKTGKFFSGWPATVKAHKFKQQLMFYKLLVENSNSFKGYRVNRGAIEFAEPEDGDIVSVGLEFKEEEMTDFRKLISAVWQSIQSLDLPTIDKYPKSLRGIKQFEQELVKKVGL